MKDFLLANYSTLYTTGYFVAFCVIALWEGFTPRRSLVLPLGSRWFANIALTVFDIALVYLLLSLTVGYDMITFVAAQQWGLLAIIELPVAIEFILALIVLDLSRYLLHFGFHHVPVLWRLHRVHHTDQDYDITTGLRFHPLEAIVVVIYDVAVYILLGVPILAIVVYRLINVVMAIFAHANTFIPLAIDQQLRKVLVTPDVHRIHHSAAEGESNCNFGGITPCWDRLFGTYIDQPALGHEHMIMGLSDCQNAKYSKLVFMLMQPFVKRYQHS